MLGYFWTFYGAFFPLLSYVFIFFFVARIEVKGAQGMWGYMVYVFSGLVPWLFFTRVVAEAIDALTANLDLLRQAIFPVEIITIVSTAESLIIFFLQASILAIVAVYLHYSVLYKLLLFPLFCLLLYLFGLGLGWILSILGFFLRDLKDVLSTSIQFLVYLTPIMYGQDNVPPKIWLLVLLNPMTHAINFFRDIFYHDDIQDPLSMPIFAAIAIITFAVGYLSILKVKKTIADRV
jgi:ABC-type polysaccharide/polyol phosphate export permease